MYDVARGWFWITAVKPSPPDQLVAVDPTTAKVVTSIALPGCKGAHGLRIAPDGKSALIACENNDTLARVDLELRAQLADSSLADAAHLVLADHARRVHVAVPRHTDDQVLAVLRQHLNR